MKSTKSKKSQIMRESIAPSITPRIIEARIMPVNEYRFVTLWKINAPLADVWEIISDTEHFPEWWKAVKKIEILERGDASGVNTGLFHPTFRTLNCHIILFF